jgi:PUA domain protein
MELEDKLGKSFSEFIGEGDVEMTELDDGREVILSRGRPLVIRTKEGIFPTLAALNQVSLKRVVVDMGAVPHVASGADVMAPGVTAADDEISPGEGVVIVDERHGKPLAIGLALVAGRSMRAPKGRVVKNLHHVGDEIWALLGRD